MRTTMNPDLSDKPTVVLLGIIVASLASITYQFVKGEMMGRG